jgi:transcriptional regulator with XRE-family HTH domain
MSTPSRKNQAQSNWDDIFSFKNEEHEIEHDAQILIYRFLSEVEKFQNLQGINKKELAKKIKTSPSFITQIFRGSKAINFELLAKLQKALNISFQISAKSKSNELYIVDEDVFLHQRNKYHTESGFWTFKNRNSNYSLNKDKEIILNPNCFNESKALKA